MQKIVLNFPGVGDEIHNFVYRFAPWRDLGCWRDKGDGRTMSMLANFRYQIDWFHLEKTGEYWKNLNWDELPI